MSTIVFPTLTNRSVAEAELGLKANTQVFVSELDGSVQTLELPGARWTLAFRPVDLDRVDAAQLEAFIAQLRGQANRARVPLLGRTAPRGTWAGSPVVNNEVGSPTLSQTGTSLEVNGFTAAATVKAGDYFNLGTNGQLLMVTADATANGSGEATLSVEPAIREAPGHGLALVSSSVVIPLMILSDPHAKWRVKAGGFTDFAFDLVEVFA